MLGRALLLFLAVNLVDTSSNGGLNPDPETTTPTSIPFQTFLDLILQLFGTGGVFNPLVSTTTTAAPTTTTAAPTTTTAAPTTTTAAPTTTTPTTTTATTTTTSPPTTTVNQQDLNELELALTIFFLQTIR